MAAREDANREGSFTEGRAIKGESTEVVNGEYVIPEGEFVGIKSNKNVAKEKPVTCKGKTNCKLKAVIGVQHNTKGLMFYCPRHWSEVEKDKSQYDPNTRFPITIRDTTTAADLRGDFAQRQKINDAHAAQADFNATNGEVVRHVRNPGRPGNYVSEEVESADPVSTVIESAKTKGGHPGYAAQQQQRLDNLYDDLSRNYSSDSNYGDNFEEMMGDIGTSTASDVRSSRTQHYDD